MTKKIKFWSIIGLTSITIITPATYFLYQYWKPNIVSLNNQKIYKVTINGAVDSPGTYTFNEPRRLRTIIFKANVLANADLSSLELEKIIYDDCEVTIPYKVNSIKKINWNSLKDVKQLTKLGIKSSIARLIINYRRQNESTTWEKINAIKGIGKISLAQLKDIIDLF